MVVLQNSTVYNNKEIVVLIKRSCIQITLSVYSYSTYISKLDYNQLKSETMKSILQNTVQNSNQKTYYWKIQIILISSSLLKVLLLQYKCELGTTLRRPMREGLHGYSVHEHHLKIGYRSGQVRSGQVREFNVHIQSKLL